ncbi:MAG: hypothetical protein LUE12_09480 [Ruminococcus sp.]|nr:hypothetical protein [Ruminococcus sp.]
MSMTALATSAVVLVTVIIIIIAVRQAVKAVKRQLRNASSLINQISAVTEQTQTTPRTVSGSEGMMKVRLSKDFPEFNADIAREIVTNALSAYFASFNAHRVSASLEDCTTNAFLGELEMEVLADSVFKDVRIHKTVISDYRKTGEEAVITWQSAVEYSTDKMALAQYVYETRYVYYLAENAQGENESLICEYCGAPIKSLGEKVCEYCGAQISASVERTWKINKIKRTR